MLDLAIDLVLLQFSLKSFCLPTFCDLYCSSSSLRLLDFDETESKVLVKNPFEGVFT